LFEEVEQIVDVATDRTILRGHNSAISHNYYLTWFSSDPLFNGKGDTKLILI